MRKQIAEGSEKDVKQERTSPGMWVSQKYSGIEMLRETALTGNIERAYFPAGQVVGRIEDLSTCREVIVGTVTEAEQTSGEPVWHIP